QTQGIPQIGKDIHGALDGVFRWVVGSWELGVGGSGWLYCPRETVAIRDGRRAAPVGRVASTNRRRHGTAVRRSFEGSRRLPAEYLRHTAGADAVDPRQSSGPDR